MDLQSAVFSAGVMNESQFPEPVHEEAYARTSRPNHFCEGFLADLGNHGLGNAVLAKMSEHEKHAGQSLFAGIKQLVDQILFIPDIARQQIGHEHVGKGVTPMQGAHHCFFLNAQQAALRHRHGRSHAHSLSRQCAFSKKIPIAQNTDGRFLARVGHDGRSDFAPLDVEDCVRQIPLGEDSLLSGDAQAFPTLSNGCEEDIGSELTTLPAWCCHSQLASG